MNSGKIIDAFSSLSMNVQLRRRQNEQIRLYFKENLKNEISRGIYKILVNPHTSVKIFWVIFILISIGLSSFLVVKTFLAYFAYEVFTTTRIIFETSAPFPKVTICNQNQFSTKYALEFLSETNDMHLPGTNIFNRSHMGKLTPLERFNLINKIYFLATSRMLSRNFTDEKRKMLGQNLNDILFTCSFNNQKCTADDFVWKFDRFQAF
jgi:hypothetical protein